jgi:hypothetical protein
LTLVSLRNRAMLATLLYNDLELVAGLGVTN